MTNNFNRIIINIIGIVEYYLFSLIPIRTLNFSFCKMGVGVKGVSYKICRITHNKFYKRSRIIRKCPAGFIIQDHIGIICSMKFMNRASSIFFEINRLEIIMIVNYCPDKSS